MKYELIPVKDKNGNIQLYDIYIDGVWHGSRRTESQCMDYVRYIQNGNK